MFLVFCLFHFILVLFLGVTTTKDIIVFVPNVDTYFWGSIDLFFLCLMIFLKVFCNQYSFSRILLIFSFLIVDLVRLVFSNLLVVFVLLLVWTYPSTSKIGSRVKLANNGPLLSNRQYSLKSIFITSLSCISCLVISLCICLCNTPVNKRIDFLSPNTARPIEGSLVMCKPVIPLSLIPSNHIS